MKLLKSTKLKLTLNSQRLEYQDLMQTLQNTIAELELVGLVKKAVAAPVKAPASTNKVQQQNLQQIRR